MNTISFDRDQIVFKQGDYSDCMYDIIRGKIGVFNAFGSEEEKLIAELGEGQSLGEMGMIEVFPRSATAVALEDGTLLAVIREDELNEYFRDKPEKLLSIMRQLSSRLRETTQKYADACRVVYESEEAEKSGGEKSDWLKEHRDYFVDAYSRTTQF